MGIRTLPALGAFVCLLVCAWGLAECRLDVGAGVAANARPDAAGALVRVQLPKPGTNDPVLLYHRDALVVPDHWYYVTLSSGQQSGKSAFRSRGRVLRIEPLESSPERAKVRVVRLTDDPNEPEAGVFAMTYEIARDQPVVQHAMTFTPRRPTIVPTYQFFAGTDKPSATTHRFVSLEQGWRLKSKPAATQEAYGRLSFSCRHPWLALEETLRHRATMPPRRVVCLGAPPADVASLGYAIEFKRFELSRNGGRITPEEPLADFAWFGLGEDAAAFVRFQRDFESRVVRPSRSAEPEPPVPTLAPAPPPTFGTRVLDSERSIEVEAGDFRLSVEKSTGAISRLQIAEDQLLDKPGGVVLVQWPDRRRVGPAGRITDLKRGAEEFSLQWAAEGLTVRHNVKALDRRVLWTVSIPNAASTALLFEVRFSLPLRLGAGRWFYWNGLQLQSVHPSTAMSEMTTLAPGGFLSQGIFPAVCLHDERKGVALGLQPLDIQSFYGSRVSPPDDVFHYAVRLAVPPGKARGVSFVIYATDPNWSWRSCIERYWSFWPDVFAAPARDDIWGLYAASSPAFVHRQGDKFIEVCRRLRVGGMELYAPFTKTGDFYPDAEPAIAHPKEPLSHDDVRRLYETANIASCNLSYVIPTKCERETAKTKYADSIIRLSNGDFFLSDIWDVMGGHREKLAAMFAWGDSFGENLRAELRQIVSNFRPDGFYLDNGAFVWQDYGRMTAPAKPSAGAAHRSSDAARRSSDAWSAFDDEGRVYTNAGIAYAALLDDLREFASLVRRAAPHIHRNPGEFIQYFAGFRAHSYLTNVLSTQRHYIRSHRLIMGYKPIFPGHPRLFATKRELLEALEMGGLLWLTGFKRDLEPLAQAWAPVAIALARAGWRPVPRAVACPVPGAAKNGADANSVRIERFGEGAGSLFTLRNLSEQDVVTKVTVAGEFPQLYDFHGKTAIPTRLNTRPAQPDSRADHAAQTEFELPIPADDMLVLCAAPRALAPRGAPRLSFPAAAFLAEAKPTSILLRPNASTLERQTARRLKGFLELQAELLNHTAEVEIAEQSPSRYPNHVTLEPSSGKTEISATGESRLTVAVSSEEDTPRVLSDFLDTVAKPFAVGPPQWTPCQVEKTK